MYLKIEQKTTNLFDATFNILDENNTIVGDATLKGQLESLEAIIKFNYKNENYTLKHEYLNFKEKLFATLNSVKYLFRPYTILKNEVNIGRIGKRYIKHKITKYAVTETSINDKTYYTYFCGLGEQGYSFFTYDNDLVIAEIRKSHTVIDGLNIYEMKCSNPDDIIMLII